MNIVIERLAEADAEPVLEYLKQAGSETDNLTFGSEGMPFSVEAEAAFIAGMEGSRDDIMLAAKDDGRIIGIASLNRLPRRMGHRGDFGVSVLKEYWNRGIGSRLLGEIIGFAKENAFEIIDLNVRSDNAGAIHLYEKFGFVKIGTHPAFCRIGDAEIPCDYMCLKLK